VTFAAKADRGRWNAGTVRNADGGLTATVYSTRAFEALSPQYRPRINTARIAQFVVPGLPMMSRERGDWRERVFFGEDDYALDRDLPASQCHVMAARAN
jgi:hypothetical protein